MIKTTVDALVNLSGAVRDMSSQYNAATGGLSAQVDNPLTMYATGAAIYSRYGAGALASMVGANAMSGAGVSPASMGERGQWMLAIQAWSSGNGPYPGPMPGSNSVGGSGDGP